MGWDGARALVTGAGGFIGSHLVEHLLMSGAHVTAFSHYRSIAPAGHLREIGRSAGDRLTVMYGDVRDPKAVSEALSGQEYVLHLAASISVAYSFQHPREVLETNLLGTYTVLEQALKTEPRQVVIVSSSEVYGTAQFVPIDESHPLSGQSPYAASKIGAEQLARSFYLSYGLPVVIVRPFNTYGPRQSPRAVIPSIILQALQGEEIHLGNLAARRDFTYVEDTARGLAAAAQAKAAVGEVLNLGTGVDWSVKDVVDRAASILGKAVKVTVDPSRLRPQTAEVERLVAGVARARRLLGWQASVDFSDGLARTAEWLATHCVIDDGAP